MIQEYLEHHCPPNGGTGNMILEWGLSALEATYSSFSA